MKEYAGFLKTSQELDVVVDNLSEKAGLQRLSQRLFEVATETVQHPFMKDLIFSFNRIPSGNALGDEA